MVVCFGSLTLEVAKKAVQDGADRLCLNFTSLSDMETGALVTLAPSLKEVYVLGEGSALEALADLCSLRLLQIHGDPRKAFRPVQRFRSLEELELPWPSRLRIDLQLPILKRLRLQGVRDQQGEPILELPKLETLSLVGGKVVDLAWLPALRSLEVDSIRGLRPGASFGVAAPVMESLSLGSVRGSSLLSGVVPCRALRRLELTNCGPLPSLNWVEHLACLQEISIAGSTNVLDGDLSPLDRLSTEKVFFNNRRHYNRKQVRERRVVPGMYQSG